jgi:NPCBM/NEW2 domain-containing protein
LRIIALLVAAALVVSPPAGAATVYSVSARPLNAELLSVTADRKLVVVAGGKKSVIPLQQLYRIRVQDRAPMRSAKASVELRTTDGTRLFGASVKSKQAVGLLVASLGRSVHFDVDVLLGLRFERAEKLALSEQKFEAELARPDKEADLLFVSTEKGSNSFEVAVTRVGPKRTTFNWKGEDREIDTSRIAAIVFANSRAEAPARAAVRLTDESVLCGGIEALANKRLTVALGDTKIVLPLANVAAIDLANPDVSFLSDQRPVKVEETPFFNHVWTHQINRSVGGSALSLDGRTYDSGIGCHTRTVLTYDLGGGYKRFAAVIGIDDEARPRGSVEFIIKADGKKLFSRKLTGSDKAVTIDVDVTGAKRLALITDFAEDASVGDHADWADARLIK